MEIEIIDCKQGTPEWLKARAGIPTASKFQTTLAKGVGGGDSKTRDKYMRELAGEIITGRLTESYSNDDMERGKAEEPHARERYAFIVEEEIKEVGFIRQGRKGCSPDGLVGAKGMVEFKSAAPHIQIDRLKREEIPSEHRFQLQGNLWVANREWIDFVSFCPGLPTLICRAYRDEPLIRDLSAGVNLFLGELDAMVEQIKGMGDFKRAA